MLLRSKAYGGLLHTKLKDATYHWKDVISSCNMHITVVLHIGMSISEPLVNLPVPVSDKYTHSNIPIKSPSLDAALHSPFSSSLLLYCCEIK